MSEDHTWKLFGNVGWKENIKQYGRSTQKSAVVCRDAQVVLNTRNSHHRSAADSHWMQWMHSSPLLSLKRALSLYEGCSHFSADVLKIKAEDTILTPELELQPLSWQEAKYYWSMERRYITSLEAGWNMEFMWPPLVPVENGFTYKGTRGLRAFPWMNYSCASEVLLPVPASLYRALLTSA